MKEFSFLAVGMVIGGIIGSVLAKGDQKSRIIDALLKERAPKEKDE